MIACAYPSTDTDDRDLQRTAGELEDEAHQVMGSSAAEETVRTAHARATSAGAGQVRTVDATWRSSVDVLIVHTTD